MNRGQLRIRRIDIENFRGIKSASWRLPTDLRFFALIGPGDSTKTTVLTALERALYERSVLTVLDTDFYNTDVTRPIKIRVAVDNLPNDLLNLDTFGAFLAGINDKGDWIHEPDEDSQPCIIIEHRVDADLEPVWQSYRPPLEGLEDEEPHAVRAKYRSRMAAYRIDDRIDAHLRWSRTSSLGKLTTNRNDTRSTLTQAARAARDAAASAVSDTLRSLADEVKYQVQAIGTTEFGDLKPGLDFSLTNTQGNLALFEGNVPLTNFGLGTKRLAGTATQQLANQGNTTLLVDEVEYGLEPHRLLHLLGYLRASNSHSQVLITTHSPTALQHINPEELFMVRSTSGETVLRPLDSPASLRKLLKTSPEAFLARRIVINEGKTEYGVVLELLAAWDEELEPGPAPSAALGVVAIEGKGGPQSLDWAEQFLAAGYEVVLFIDSDDEATNHRAPDVSAMGGALVQWEDGHSIETAVCAQLDEDALTEFIQAALEVTDDRSSAEQSYADKLKAFGAPHIGNDIDPLDVGSWASVSGDLECARKIVGNTAKAQGWFKRVDKGRRLGKFILDTPALRGGEVATRLAQLQEFIYARSDTAPGEAAVMRHLAPQEDAEQSGA